MQLTNNAKGTVAFSTAMALMVLYCTTNKYCATEASSGFIPKDFFMWNGALGVPLTLVLTGAVMLAVWNGNRLGFMLALILGSLTALFHLWSFFNYVTAGSIMAAGICAAVVAAGLLTAWFAYRGWAETPARTVSANS